MVWDIQTDLPDPSAPTLGGTHVDLVLDDQNEAQQPWFTHLLWPLPQSGCVAAQAFWGPNT